MKTERLPLAEPSSSQGIATLCASAACCACLVLSAACAEPVGPASVVAGNPSIVPGPAQAQTSAGPVTTPSAPPLQAPTDTAATVSTPGATQGPLASSPLTVEPAPSNTTVPAAPAVVPFEPPLAALRRLTRTQFRNAVRDVFGVEVDTSLLDSDSWTGNFAVVGAATVVTSERGVEQYHAAIERAANAVFDDEARRTQFLGCTPNGQTGDSCLLGLLNALGKTAWRRPLESTELERLEAVAVGASDQLGNPVEGARWATVALLTSPNFLYRPELGVPSAAATYRLTGYELASRLAFLLWNSLPDDALLDAAANGALDTSDGVRAEATRMLDAASGRQAVGSFAEELMRLDRIASQAKDAVLYPEYSPTLQQAMVRDVRQAWEDVVFDEQTSVLAVFSTPRVFVNSELAQLYGLDATGLDPNTFEARQLPEGYPRLGLLSKPGFLSQFANQKEGSPTLRGKFMRDALMCTTVPPPPADVDPVFEETATDEPMTKRQRLEQHRADARCAGCHALMDPLGLPFETFDAIGRYRTTDNGLPIDPSGAFDGVEVADAVELAHTIESSTAVARCLTRKYYAYAVGHEERKVDASVIETLYARFESTGFDMRELMLDVVTHEAFSSVAEPL